MKAVHQEHKEIIKLINSVQTSKVEDVKHYLQNLQSKVSDVISKKLSEYEKAINKTNNQVDEQI